MKYQFHLTCRACPEQYDVMDGHLIVAYVRYRHGVLTVNPVLPKWETRRFTPDDQREAILQRIDRAVSRYWQHPFRRAQDGNDHPIDPKTGDYTDGYHE